MDLLNKYGVKTIEECVQKIGFVPLHNHTEYSIQDCAQDIPTIIERLKELNINACAITDHGKMYGVYEFYKLCTDAGIKPIIGVEAYIEATNIQSKRYHHMILLAKNAEGYKSLCQSTRVSEKRKYKGKPILTDADLAHFFSQKDCIIATSACLGGEIQQLLLNGQYNKAKERAIFYNGIFGQGNFYIELQNHFIKEQLSIIPLQVKLAKELNIPLIISSDSHFARPEDKKIHDMVLCLQWGKTLDTLVNNAYTEHHCIKGALELYDDFKNILPDEVILEALENTVNISNMCNFTFETGQHYPKYPKLDGNTSDEALREWAYNSMPKTVIGYNLFSKEKQKEYLERLDVELDVIKKTGYSDYFLIVADVIRYARSIGAYTGLGRGSGVGSLVAHSIGITKVDPIEFGLYFDRFLNLERVSPPDFDIDFDRLRDEVVKYTVNTYGEEKVCHIITFGTMAARGCIRDVGRVMGVELSLVDRVAKMVPLTVGVTLKKALGFELNKEGKVYEEFYSIELRKAYDDDPKIKNLLDNAMKLEGLVRQVGTHAAAVIISDDELTNYIPLEWDDEKGLWRSQFYKDYNEELGLLKMDYLGLNTLNILKDTVELVKERHGIEYNQDTLIEAALNDKRTIEEIYQKGLTTEVFQFESKGMKDTLKAFCPTSLNDLILLNAVYRPGPLQYIPKIIYNKNHPEEIKYDHECLKEILEKTYGYPVFQEQIMAIFRVICGYSLGKADIIRRAMGKKKEKDLKAARADFIEGYKRLGLSEERANEFFDEIMEFAKYSFNKSHAAAYTITSLETAFCKLNYPVEYMTACLKNSPTADALPVTLNEAKEMGIKILPPDINKSSVTFTPEGDNAIRFGLSGIKNVGKAAIEIINGQPYKDISDFLNKVSYFENTDKSVIEAMIYAGAFDSFGYNRKTLIENISLFTEYKKGVKRQTPGQIDLFSMGTIDNLSTLNIKEYEEYPYQYKLDREKEFLSCYVSGHPLDQYKIFCSLYSEISIADISEEQNGQEFVIVGRINDTKALYRKSDGKPMCKFILEDVTGSIDTICFTSAYNELKGLLYEGAILKCKVKVQADDEHKQLILIEAHPLNALDKVFIKVPNREKIQDFYSIAKENAGGVMIYFYISNEKRLEQYTDCLIDLNDAVQSYFGKENIAI